MLAEGPGWLAVAKPPRLIVHRSAGAEGDYPALQRVRDQIGAKVYPVHRLDRQASGCLLFATDPGTAAALQAGLASASKIYLALTRGAMRGEPAVVEGDLKDENGTPRASRSRVEPLAWSREPRCSLLRVRPETGRYHQVRRHVRRLNHPILGDSDHGDTRANRRWRQELGLTRLGLHALSIEMDFPDGARRRIICPLFADQASLFRGLPWWGRALERQPEIGWPAIPIPSDVG